MKVLLIRKTRINPEEYGYELIEDDILVPAIISKDVIPGNFPYNRLKCAKETFVLVV